MKTVEEQEQSFYTNSSLDESFRSSKFNLNTRSISYFRNTIPITMDDNVPSALLRAKTLEK